MIENTVSSRTPPGKKRSIALISDGDLGFFLHFVRIFFGVYSFFFETVVTEFGLIFWKIFVGLLVGSHLIEYNFAAIDALFLHIVV